MEKLKKKNDFISDEELVSHCKMELPYQTMSFEILVKRYQNKVFHKTLTLLKNREDAEDIAKEIFLKVFSKLPTFKGNSSFSTWLYSITVNTCLNVMDQKKRKLKWFSIEFSELKEMRSDKISVLCKRE